MQRTQASACISAGTQKQPGHTPSMAQKCTMGGTSICTCLSNSLLFQASPLNKNSSGSYLASCQKCQLLSQCKNFCVPLLQQKTIEIDNACEPQQRMCNICIHTPKPYDCHLTPVRHAFCRESQLETGCTAAEMQQHRTSAKACTSSFAVWRQNDMLKASHIFKCRCQDIQVRTFMAAGQNKPLCKCAANAGSKPRPLLQGH